MAKGATRGSHEACILVENDGQRVALTCSQYARPTFPDHEDHKVAEDIILLQFDPQAHSVNPAHLFFDMTRMRTLDQVSEQQVTLYFAVGYPTEFTELVGNFDDPATGRLKGMCPASPSCTWRQAAGNPCPRILSSGRAAITH